MNALLPAGVDDDVLNDTASVGSFATVLVRAADLDLRAEPSHRLDLRRIRASADEHPARSQLRKCRPA